MWQKFEEELRAAGVASSAQLEKARERQRHEGGLLVTRLIEAGCPAKGVLKAASRASGIPVATKAMLRRARTLGRPPDLDWAAAHRHAYAPLGDGRVVFADPATALEPSALRLPPHTPMLAEERKVHALLDALSGKLHPSTLPSDEGPDTSGEGPPAPDAAQQPTDAATATPAPAEPPVAPQHAAPVAGTTAGDLAPIGLYAQPEIIEVDDVAPLPPSPASPAPTEQAARADASFADPPAASAAPTDPPAPAPTPFVEAPVRTRRRELAGPRAVRLAQPASWRDAPARAPDTSEPRSTLSVMLWAVFFVLLVVGGVLAFRASRVDEDVHAVDEAEAAMAADDDIRALERARAALLRPLTVEEQQRALWVQIQVNLKAQRWRAVQVDVQRYLEQAPPGDPHLAEASATAALVEKH